jgi:SPP1 gp7 family putative phage head morphogenesis protein
MEETLEKLKAAFPAIKTIKYPRRTLVPSKKIGRVKEADPRIMELDNDTDVASGFVDDETWNDLVQAYLDEYVQTGRTEGKIRFKAGDEREFVTRREWELERDFTHDFVSQVRAGQIDVARENGYNDFVWISVLDNKTDECCVWRDGKLTSEIEKSISQGKDDECQTSVPPAHPFCRCDIAPVTEKIDDFKLPQIGDFEEWLTAA